MHLILKRGVQFFIPILIVGAVLFVLNFILEHKEALVERTLPTTVAQPVVKHPAVKQKDEPKEAVAQDIVIDPAHGGDDLGMVGYRDSVESQANLLFAFKLARALRMKGISVHLTRTDDKTVGLSTRLGLAERYKPLIYISINCSYSEIKTISGWEIYGFTPEQSGDDQLETQENEPYESESLKYLPKTEESMVVEDRVSKEIKKALKLPYRSALERKFLKQLALDPKTPGLALFIGYLSNSEDVKRLSDSKKMDQIVDVVAVAIERGLPKP